MRLKNEIDTKIHRMKILYEIKTKKLYKYDGLKVLMILQSLL